jgi:hypothetical protein
MIFSSACFVDFLKQSLDSDSDELFEWQYNFSLIDRAYFHKWLMSSWHWANVAGFGAAWVKSKVIPRLKLTCLYI